MLGRLRVKVVLEILLAKTLRVYDWMHIVVDQVSAAVCAGPLAYNNGCVLIVS